LVRVNDVVFAVHAVVLTVLTLFQTYLYKADQKHHIPHIAIGVSCLASLFLVVLLIMTAFGWTELLDVLYYLSSIKVAITLIKCIPQMLLNYQRQSTVGWSIINILLDFSGGILSIAQEFLDAYITQSWSGISGNPVKWVLGVVTIGFDLGFMYQHYVLYWGKESVVKGDREEEDARVREEEEDTRERDEEDARKTDPPLSS